MEQFLYKLTPTQPDMLSKGLTGRETEIIGIMANDPAVKENEMAAQLFPFRIALI